MLKRGNLRIWPYVVRVAEKRDASVWRVKIDGAVWENVFPFSASDSTLWYWVNLTSGIVDTEPAVLACQAGEYVYWMGTDCDTVDIPIAVNDVLEFSFGEYLSSIGSGNPNDIQPIGNTILHNILSCIKVPDADGISYYLPVRSDDTLPFRIELLRSLFGDSKTSIFSSLTDLENFEYEDLVFALSDTTNSEFIVRFFRSREKKQFAFKLMSSPHFAAIMTNPRLHALVQRYFEPPL